MIFNKQRKYFKKKLEGVQKMIWDLQFKREKTLVIREEIRQEYDNLKAKLHNLDGQIKSQKETPTMKQEEIARLDDQKLILDKDIERKLNLMKSLDLEVNGTKPTNEYPDGVDGVNQTLDSLRELQKMLRDYIKKI